MHGLCKLEKPSLYGGKPQQRHKPSQCGMASLPSFDYRWNAQREESIGAEDSEVPMQMLAAHGGVHGAAGGIPIKRVHDILRCDAASN